MKKTIAILALLTVLPTAAAIAQVREPATAQPGTTIQNPPAPPLAPQTVKAQYTGGLFGYNKKIKGTLNFDDVNKRLVFRNQEGKEVFGLPYKSLLVLQPSSRSYTPTGAAVGSMIPLPGAGLLGFIKSKHRYLVTQFNDPDSEVQGTVNFKVEDKEMLQSVIYTLGTKAELKQRGDAFYRPREIPKPVI